jgi:hypothetical protein
MQSCDGRQRTQYILSVETTKYDLLTNHATHGETCVGTAKFALLFVFKGVFIRQLVPPRGLGEGQGSARCASTSAAAS